MIDYIGGTLILLLFFGIIALAYHAHMSSIYKDIADEEADEIADKRFDDAIKHARIRIRKRLEIIDEMGKTV